MQTLELYAGQVKIDGLNDEEQVLEGKFLAITGVPSIPFAVIDAPHDSTLEIPAGLTPDLLIDWCEVNQDELTQDVLIEELQANINEYAAFALN